MENQYNLGQDKTMEPFNDQCEQTVKASPVNEAFVHLNKEIERLNKAIDSMNNKVAPIANYVPREEAKEPRGTVGGSEIVSSIHGHARRIEELTSTLNYINDCIEL